MATSGAFNGGMTTITDSSIQNAIVDNENYAYSVQLDLGAGGGAAINFRGLRITYEITEPLP